MNNTVLEEAKRYLTEVDHIIDMYDLLIVWVSPKWLSLTGYTSDELIGKQVLQFLDDSYTETDKRKLVVDRIIKPKGFDTVHIRAKNGLSVHAKTEYNVADIGGVVYLTGRVVETVE